MKNTLREADSEIIAIDSMTSRRTHNRARGGKPLRLVSAWAARQRLVLGQQAIDDKSSEIKANPLLLDRLMLRGALVTIAAIGTQVEIRAEDQSTAGATTASRQGEPSSPA